MPSNTRHDLPTTPDEFSAGAFDAPGPIERRSFLRLMAASAALAAASLPGACTRRTPDSIVPRARNEPGIIPGVSRRYATTLTRRGYGMGAIVRADDARPTKIEGNPDHPASLGATDAIMQAELLSLYDPARRRAVRGPMGDSGWAEFERELGLLLSGLRRPGGAGLHVVMPPTTSPTVMNAVARARERFPASSWHRHDPLDPGWSLGGIRMATGRPLEPVLDLSQARAIVSLDHDLFALTPAGVRYARDFMDARRASLAHGALLPQLWVAEPAPSLCASKATSRIACRSSDIAGVACAIARALGMEAPQPGINPDAHAWADAAASALRSAGDGALLTLGAHQPPEVHALALAINSRLGAVGAALRLVEPIDATHTFASELDDCLAALDAGEVELLLLLDVNPAYDTPADVHFAASLTRAGAAVHLGHFDNETSRLCAWQLPAPHELEQWGDARAFDGTASLLQPLTTPISHGRSVLAVLSLLAGDEPSSDLALVRRRWRSVPGAAPSSWEDWWVRTLRAGVVAGSSAPSVVVPRIAAPDLDSLARTSIPAGPEVVICPDRYRLEGRYAENAWLQELPDPITQLCWENAAVISPALAASIGARTGDVVRIEAPDGAGIELPALVLPGVADSTVALSLGYGRSAASPRRAPARADNPLPVSGALGFARGVDAAPLRRRASPWLAANVRITRTGKRQPLALVQLETRMNDSPPVRTVTPGSGVEPDRTVHLPLYLAKPPMDPPQWGMSIDLAACTGCGACVAACQAENNIPVVGPEEIGKGRRMHWIRVDRYLEPGDQGRPLFQPLACVHCENAPCELVCPTGATQHSHDGLNEMNYARCIGTRYCSNNCPYKVRRFNFFQYAAYDDASRRLRNPRVTTRAKGVMEKCTYCVQRIRAAEMNAEPLGSPLPDGAVVPACAQACPTTAIVFGDVSDPGSRVSTLKRDPRSYALLGELNTRPRTTYLAEVRRRPGEGSAP